MEFGELVQQAIKRIFTKEPGATHSTPPEKPQRIVQSPVVQNFQQTEAQRVANLKDTRDHYDPRGTAIKPISKGTQGKP